MTVALATHADLVVLLARPNPCAPCPSCHLPASPAHCCRCGKAGPPCDPYATWRRDDRAPGGFVRTVHYCGID